MSASSPKHIVIIGAGIIGCTTAYYLTRHPQYSSSHTSITLLEASKKGAAQGASGKAGGLVARWAYPKEIVDLSFDEHVRLAEEHGGAERWGWRHVNAGSWEGRGDIHAVTLGLDRLPRRKSLEKTVGLDDDEGKTTSTLDDEALEDAWIQSGKSADRETKGLPVDLAWVQEDLTHSYAPMARSGTTAQVHPYLFTTAMLDLAVQHGAKLVKGRATAIETSSDNIVTGVSYLDADGAAQRLQATDVVLAAGAWSPSIVPSLPITHTRAHSITIRPQPGVTISPYVLFTEITIPSGVFSPEICARPDNEVYVCGPGDEEPLPDTVDDVVVDPDACESVWQQAASISQELREGTVDRRQACYLPLGGPIIGAASTVGKGLIIATGHTCWGISNAPGTAKAVSELVLDGEIRCASLKKMDPSCFL